MTECSRNKVETKDGKSIFGEGTKTPMFWAGEEISHLIPNT